MEASIGVNTMAQYVHICFNNNHDKYLPWRFTETDILSTNDHLTITVEWMILIIENFIFEDEINCVV